MFKDHEYDKKSKKYNVQDDDKNFCMINNDNEEEFKVVSVNNEKNTYYAK